MEHAYYRGEDGPGDDPPPSHGYGPKAETIRWVVGMVLVALVSYFATTYGLQERISVMEAKIQAATALQDLKLAFIQQQQDMRLATLQAQLVEVQADLKLLTKRTAP
jgi:hypothetical protein